LKGYLQGMGGASVRTGRFIGMDLDDPPVDFLALARSMAVDATAVDHAGDVGDAVKSALESGKPHLLELPISA
jgi:benzoylformate decarboxylase